MTYFYAPVFWLGGYRGRSSWLYRARQLLFINKRLRARSSLNSSFTRQRVPTALSELRPILFRCKICKLNTLSVTKHYAEQSAGKCTVFQSLRMWNIRINVKICIKISFCISRPFQPAQLRVDWNCRTGHWRTGHWRTGQWRTDMGNWL